MRHTDADLVTTIRDMLIRHDRKASELLADPDLSGSRLRALDGDTLQAIRAVMYDTITAVSKEVRS